MGWCCEALKDKWITEGVTNEEIRFVYEQAHKVKYSEEYQ